MPTASVDMAPRNVQCHNIEGSAAVSSPAVQPIVALLSGSVGGNPNQYIVEKAFAHHDLDWRYLTVEIDPEDLGDAMRGMRAMGFGGGHCDNPHKQSIVPLLDRTSATAAMVAAVNLILREGDELVGENTEGKGLLEALRRLIDPAGKRIVLLGAGRMARAIGVELAAAGPAEIGVVNRDRKRAEELISLLADKLGAPIVGSAWEGQLPPESDVLINATSIGHEDPDARAPLDLESLDARTIVADVTINPPATWLLHEAGRRGCTTLDGLAVYIEQLAIGVKLWTGIDPDREVMREAAEEFLGL